MRLTTPILLATLGLALAGCDRDTPAPPLPPPPPSAAAPAPAPAASPATAAVPGGGATGEAVYTQTCTVCHTPGLAGAPKLGDRADWAPRIAQGREVLYRHAIEGYTGAKGVMPPRGGSTRSDAEIRAAVDHMVSQSSP